MLRALTRFFRRLFRGSSRTRRSRKMILLVLIVILAGA
jgi:hypothetical protein